MRSFFLLKKKYLDFSSMPRVKTFRRPRVNRRKPRRMRRTMRKSKLTIYNSPFPNKRIVKMRYVGNFSLDPSAQAPAWHIFSANSIFDPDSTSIGHQPYGHDQYQALYNHYTVLGSKITVTYFSTGNNADSGSGFAGIALKDDTVMEGNFETIREAKNARTRILTYERPAIAKHYFSIKKFYSLGSRDRLRASFGSNPSEQMFYQCFATGIGATQNLSPINGSAVIDYIVLVEELKDLGQS